MTERNVRGRATMVPLGNVTPLLLPWAADPFGRLRPPVSVEAMRMSAELARCTYEMKIEPWRQAGWRDVTIQVDGELSRFRQEEHWISSRWRLHRARAKIRQRNPIGQVMGAMRQREKSDTGKALVMIHPATEGRYVVAISFMGTGGRFYDWFSNFRVTSEEGLHKGFLQLTRQFEDNEEHILFPETARELGLERLSLRHILEEARHPGSRFTLWLSGHSQGAALMQVYALHKLRDGGVLPRNMVGYGFASPSVASGSAVSDPAAYPLYHILNSDDLVPRMGAMVHLGLCLTYPAGEAIRRKCYGWSQDEASRLRRMALVPLLQRMSDTPSCMETVVALLLVLADRSAEDIEEALSALDVHLPVKQMLAAADSRVEKVARFLIRKLEAAYRSVTGREMNRTHVAAAADETEALIHAMGLRRFMETLLTLTAAPHGISLHRDGQPPYVYIVLEGVRSLIPWAWISGDPPRPMHAAWRITAPEAAGGLVCRRRTPVSRRSPRIPKRHAPHPRRDTRHRAPVLETGGVRPGERPILPD